MKPNFKRDLEAGHAGEQAFIKLAAQHGFTLQQLEGKGADLLDIVGNKWECKTDRYDHSKTENMFLEYLGDVDKGKLGGPWKAEQDGCKYFAYYFTSHNIAYLFETQDLLTQIQQYILAHNPKLIEVPNRRWVSVGYKVPRSLLSPHLVLKNKA